MVTPHLAELLTFWFCGFEVSVAYPPSRGFHLFGAVAVLRCRVGALALLKGVCVCACISSRGFLRLPIWEQALGVKHSGAGGEDSVSLEDTAQPAQRSLEHPHIYTHRPTNALMYPCTHTDAVPLSLLYMHRHTHCFSVPSPSHPLYFACTDTHTPRALALLVSPLVLCPVKTPPWGQKSSGQGDNGKSAQTVYCCHIIKK